MSFEKNINAASNRGGVTPTPGASQATRDVCEYFSLKMKGWVLEHSTHVDYNIYKAEKKG